ncbi:MAG TPA: ROK family protein [Actinomycetota bacterium]|nr:ROK family protein [Actinomycetota bacterium]
MPAALALDVGGTKLAVGVVDARGRVLGRSRMPTPAGDDPEPLYQALLACAAAAMRDAGAVAGGLAGVGVGCGGPMRWPDGAVSPLNIPAWRDFPLRRRLARDLGTGAVLVHDDAVAIAAGEHWRGAGTGAANLLGLTVSTGVGGGLVLDGRLYHGTSGNGGHIGHTVVEPDGPPCACGGRGCLEAVASGPRTVARALADGWRPGGDGARGAAADGVALAAAAAGGDPVAGAAVARAARAVGLAVASCANLLDLEVVAIGGGFSRSGRAFWDPLRDAVVTHARLPFAAACRVVPARLGADAGLLGAAAFILRPDRYGWAAPRD